MLKRMQVRVNGQTVALDTSRKGRSLSKDQEGDLRTVTQHQAEVEKLAHELGKKLGQPCAKCGQVH